MDLDCGGGGGYSGFTKLHDLYVSYTDVKLLSPMGGF